LTVDNFWNGFEKQAMNAGLIGAIGGSRKEGIEESKHRAERSAKDVERAEKLKRKSPGDYYLNPMTAGPLSNIGARLTRRHNAAMAEQPIRSSMIPLYGMIRGGKAGKDRVEKASEE
jgi:hypothetical protein